MYTTAMNGTDVSLSKLGACGGRAVATLADTAGVSSSPPTHLTTVRPGGQTKSIPSKEPFVYRPTQFVLTTTQDPRPKQIVFRHGSRIIHDRRLASAMRTTAVVYFSATSLFVYFQYVSPAGREPQQRGPAAPEYFKNKGQEEETDLPEEGAACTHPASLAQEG